MKKIFYLLSFTIITSCKPVKPAFGDGTLTMREEYAVKGRQGLLINQKLQFGDYTTSKVKRSWTSSQHFQNRLGISPLFEFYFNRLIYKDAVYKDQSFNFEMKTVKGNTADVYASSAFSNEEIVIEGNNRLMLNAIFHNIEMTLKFENVFYAQVFIDQQDEPWQLTLDNFKSQSNPKAYKGFFVLNEDEYYLLKPINKVMGKSAAKEIWFGSIGYEILNKNNEIVAGVSLIDGGRVYFNTSDQKEHFLMANLCAVLLLQEDLESTQ